jgi:DUF1009 family protein
MSKLALLVGRGDIAAAARAAAAKQTNFDVHVFVISGDAPELSQLDVGNPNALVDQLSQQKFDLLCVVGSVDLNAERRSAIAAFLAKLNDGQLDLSDMGMEQALFAIAKEARVRLIGVHEWVPELLAGSGVIAGPNSSLSNADFDHLVRVTRTIARTDIGQAVVFASDRPIAAEDALGTDSLLARVAQIVEVHKIAPETVSLVKVAKPQQSGVGDLPTIGPQTIVNCAEGQVRNIIVEASKCLVAERGELKSLADKHKISVFGWG